jgi:septal ring factor EnvC (AmiA/AmiB activator)
MSQTQPNRVDQLESLIEQINRKLDAIATDVTDVKISQAQIGERMNSIDTQLGDLKTQVRAQDSRLWTFITALVLAVVGLLAKFLFFPQA